MDVGEWLRGLGLGRYETVFREHAIDIDVLADLTDDELAEIGVPLGDRKRLLKAIASLFTKGAAPTEAKLPATLNPAALAAGRDAERRPITVMFCDLVGSTALAARLDAEDWRGLVNAYLDEASAAVTRLGGHVLKRLGDGLMALFGYPHAQENDAERAVRAALAIQRALGEMNARNTAKGASQLSARIGLESGPVVVEARGEVFGEAPNVAARVQGLAEPGAVLVTANVQRQTAGLFVAEDKGAHELKGVAAPVTLYRIVRASGGRRTGARSLTPLVGRNEELDLLRRRWERARNGAGQLALIVGEPGIGKSRLVEEFRATLGETPHTFVELSSSQLLQNTPLHPIAEWGRQRFGADELADRRLADLENTLRLIGLDPAEYAPLLAPLVDIPLPRAAKLAPEELRRRQLAALTTWFLAGARSQPVALAFEDLHWADPTSLDLMQALAERGGQAPMLILATARPEFRPPWSLRSHHSVISLSPLDRADVALMVGELASRHALSREVIEGVSERTGGVPLFVEEVTRLLLERGEAGSLQAIPPTLQQSLAARLDRLGEAREVAQIGAVLGRDFTYALLRAVGGLDDPALQSALDKLAGADLLFVEGAAAQATYRFKHALIQDAAYDSLLKTRRQALHRRAGEVLCDQPERASTEPEVIAHHFTAAGLDDLAIEWTKAAIQQAISKNAITEAVQYLKRAIALTKRLPEGPSRDAVELGLQLQLGGLLVPTQGFAAQDVLDTFDRAHRLCDNLGDDGSLLPVNWGLWSFFTVRAELGRALQLAEAVMRLGDASDRLDVVRLGRHLRAATQFWRGELRGLETPIQEFLSGLDRESNQVFPFAPQEDPEVQALSYLAWLLWLRGCPEEAEEKSQQAIAIAQTLERRDHLAFALGFAAQYSAYRRDFKRASLLADASITLAEKHGFPFWLGAARILRGSAMVSRGRGRTDDSGERQRPDRRDRRADQRGRDSPQSR
jgi:class 3 adenylate cyclase